MSNESARLGSVNLVGLSKNDYKGAPSTLCVGCGHNSIVNQLIQIAYELNIRPQEIIRLSGIGCSSKSVAYFLGNTFGFNSLHGRMPSIGTGALMANHTLRAIGVSGDGDTASIGMGQFKHLMRRNLRMVYVVENNGVYGLTKGQFSATADEGQVLKYAGENQMPPVDICMEAIVSGCGFVARTFSGDARQVRELLKAALSHRGTAVLDIISPCVAFNNHDASTKSYGYGKEHELPLHDLGWIPVREEIEVEAFEAGEMRLVEMHDGSHIQLRKLETDYDPSDRGGALNRLQAAAERREFITGLVYYDSSRPSLAELSELTETPMSQLSPSQLRPKPEALAAIMSELK